MKAVVLASSSDPAGLNICNCLKKLGYLDCILLHESLLSLDHIDKKIEADLFIFASMHRSSTPSPILTTHSPGNWGKATSPHGGIDSSLNVAAALYIREAFMKMREMVKETGISYDVAIEATHHGPYIEKPCLFIEIGSSEKEWKDEKAGLIVANTIIHLLNIQPNEVPVLFGIGGLHTTPALSKCIDKGFALGHVCPKYALEELSPEMITQGMDNCAPKAKSVLLDWKGMGVNKQRIVALIEKAKIPFLRTDKL